MSPYYSLVEQIFEESVVEALSMYGIDVPTRSGDSFSNYNPRRIFLREAVLNKLEYEWTYSTNLRAKIAYNPTGTPQYDLDEVRKIVREYVKTEIQTETGRMQVDAERKILENLVDGQYFKKDGVKKLVDNVTSVVSPDSAKFTKLLGTKITPQTQDSYRKAVLDVLFSKTSDGLVSEIGKAEKVGGRVLYRPIQSGGAAVTQLKSGQTFAKAIVEILDNPTVDNKIPSPYAITAQGISREFENDTEVIRIKKDMDEAQASALIDPRARATVRDCESKLKQIYEGTYSRPAIMSGGTLIPAYSSPGLAAGTASFRDRLASELNYANSAVVSATSGLTVSTETRQYMFRDNRGAILTSVWESHPDLKIKHQKYTDLLAQNSSNPILRARYQSLVDYYTNELARVSATSGDAFTFKFRDGKIIVTDRLRETYDDSIKKFAKELKFFDFSSSLNQLRDTHLGVDIGNLAGLRAHLAGKGVLTPEEATLLSNTDDLIKKFEIHRQALVVVEGMKHINLSDPNFIRLKNDFIANIAFYESDPAKQAEIIAAINANDRRTLKRLINSGTGETSYDLKYKKLYEEFYSLGLNSEETFTKLRTRFQAQGMTALQIDQELEQYKKFTSWVNKRALDNEVIQGFVLRRHIETIIYAAQLVTDSKYLEKEVKKVITEEVKVRLTRHIFEYFPSTGNLGEFVGLAYEFSQQKDKWAWVKKEGWKKIVESGKNYTKEWTFVKKLQADLESFKIFNVGMKLDLYDFIKNPAGYLVEKGGHFLKSVLETTLNKFFRKRVEDLLKAFNNFKIQLRRLGNYVRQYAVSALTKYGGALGARVAVMLGASAIPVAGWIVTAVIAVLPILLKPFFGDVDILTMLKKALKFACILPALIFLLLWFIMVLPITTLFANLWPSFFTYLGQFFTKELYNYSMTHDWTFGVKNEYDITFDLADGLVNTSENKCINIDGSPKYAPLVTKTPWNNARKEDFQRIKTKNGNRNLNCKIMCNLQLLMLTMYPNKEGMIACNATSEGQRFANENGSDAFQLYWCSYSVTGAYKSDFPDFQDDSRFAAVSDLNTWFEGKVGSSMEKIQLSNGTATEYTECFDKDSIMSGAAILLSQTSSCPLSGGRIEGNHAAVFLNLDEDAKEFIYLNSNSGTIKETVPYVDCGNNQIKLKQKVYTKVLENGDIKKTTFYFCKMFQPTVVPDMLNPNRCPTNCIPNKLNY